MTPPSASYVFLSYASVERERVLAVADALEAAGVRVWIDGRAIAGGASWSAAIVDGISTCAALLLLGSAAAYGSPNVQRELNRAVEENRPLLPLRLDATPAPREVRNALAGRQWVDLLDRPAEAWLPEVLRALAGLGVLAEAEPPAAEPTVPPAMSPPTNLPAPLTSFVGREQEVVEVPRSLGTARLLTLTGPGGTGKTRLALAVAQQVAAAFPDGVWFADLSALSDAAHVAPTIALVLGLREAEGTPLLATLQTYLRDKHLLLVVDNFEQVIAAAPLVRDLLAAGPGLKVLVTSRLPLHVPGEFQYEVLPLPLPSADQAGVALLAQNPAVALFVQRAQAVRAGFTLTEENAPTVARICARLDGLPLAIELAAARIRALPPQALLARLDDRLKLLTGGGSAVPARQQTLRGALQWSYDLLPEEERRLFRRLGVFAGGCTLEAAEVVCTDEALTLDLLDGVTSLVEKSLLRQVEGVDGEPRYSMLSVLREFALGALRESGEAVALHARHAAYFDELAWTVDQAGPMLSEAVLAALDADQENFRTALTWHGEQDDGEQGADLAASLFYWFFRRSQDEGRRWLERMLASSVANPGGSGRIRALTALSNVLWWQGGIVGAHARAEEATRLARGRGDRRLLARALQALALSGAPGDQTAVLAAEEAVSIYRELDDMAAIAMALSAVAIAYARAGDPAGARAAFEEGLAVEQARAGNTWLSQSFVMNLGVLDSEAGDFASTLSRLEQAASMARQGGRPASARLLNNRGSALCELGEVERAARAYHEALALDRRLHSIFDLVNSIQGLGMVAALQDEPDLAGRLLGAGTPSASASGSRTTPAATCRRAADSATSTSSARRSGRSSSAWRGPRGRS